MSSSFVSTDSPLRTRSSVVLLDGGMGTTLQDESKIQVDGDPMWSASVIMKDPSVLVATHKRFIEAGSEIITAVSYQASVAGFITHFKVTQKEAENLVKKSVFLAREAAASSSVKVAASVGPYGAHLADWSEYTGSYGKDGFSDVMQQFQRSQIDLLIEAQPDYLAIETIPLQSEALFLSKYAATKSVPAWVSVSLNDDPKNPDDLGKILASGDPVLPLAKNVREIMGEKLVAFGANCSKISTISKFLEHLTANGVSGPFIAYPNAGQEYFSKKGSLDGTYKELLEIAPYWISLGVKYIGGCCGFSPAAIGMLKAKIESLLI